MRSPLALTQELVRFNTVNPPGAERARATRRKNGGPRDHLHVGPLRPNRQQITVAGRADDFAWPLRTAAPPAN